MRELIKIQRRAERAGAPLSAAAASLLTSRVPHGSVPAATLHKLLTGITGWQGLAERLQQLSYTMEQRGPDVVLSDGLISLTVPGADLSRSALKAAIAAAAPTALAGGSSGAVVSSIPATFMRHLVQLGLAAACGEPVLLSGPTSCKSELVAAWCDIIGRGEELLVEHLTAGGCACCRALLACGFGGSWRRLNG